MSGPSRERGQVVNQWAVEQVVGVWAVEQAGVRAVGLVEWVDVQVGVQVVEIVGGVEPEEQVVASVQRPH